MFISYWVLIPAAILIILVVRESLGYQRQIKEQHEKWLREKYRAEGLDEIVDRLEAQQGRWRAAEMRLRDVLRAHIKNHDFDSDEIDQLYKDFEQAMDYVSDGEDRGYYSKDRIYPWGKQKDY